MPQWDRTAKKRRPTAERQGEIINYINVKAKAIGSDFLVIFITIEKTSSIRIVYSNSHSLIDTQEVSKLNEWHRINNRQLNRTDRVLTIEQLKYLI